MALTKPRAHQLFDIDYKQSVRVLTDTNITLSGGAPAEVDGVVLSAQDRVLVIGQNTASQNGLYVVVTAGSGSNGTWQRSQDAAATGELLAGTIVMVTEGTVYADTQWKLVTNNPIVIGTTALTWEQNSAFAFGNIYANGTAVLANTVGDTVTLTPGPNIEIVGNAVSKSVTIGVATGITQTTFSSTPPTSPIQGDVWIDADTGIQYIYFNDGNSNQWAEMQAEVSYSSSAGGGGNVDLSAVAQSIVPAANVTHDLGSATHRWRDIYLSGNTINLGGATIKTDAASGAIALIPEPTESNPNPSGMVVSPAGGITVVSTVGGEVAGNAIANAAASPTAAPVPIDITTTPPTNGQALVWDSANSKFIPDDISGGSGGSGGVTTGKAIAMAIVFGG